MKEKIREILEKHETEREVGGGGPDVCHFAVIEDRYDEVIEDMFKLFNNELEDRLGTMKITEQLKKQLIRDGLITEEEDERDKTNTGKSSFGG